MASPDEPNEYDFFKEFDIYSAKEEGIEKSLFVKGYTDDCKFISEDSILKKINSINIFQKYNMNTTANIERFYNELTSKDDKFDKKKMLNNKLRKIDDNELNNMKELYALYKESNKIYNYLTSGNEEGCTSCSMCTEMCIEKYKKNIKRCPDNNTKFCKALYKFKELYEGNFKQDHKNKCSEDVKKLPSYSGVADISSAAEQKGNGNNITLRYIIVIISALFPVIMFFYMFTPFRQWLHSKIRRKDKIPSYEHAMTSNLLPYINHTSNQDFDNKAYNIQYKSVGKQ
ncbi:PIR protein [Plasmodium vivax]|nr:PIR protein [Plasmodium vivax]